MYIYVFKRPTNYDNKYNKINQSRGRMQCVTLKGIQFLPLKDLQHWPLQNGEISKVREALLMASDSVLYLTITRIIF